ncbi:FAD-linked oxidoreductase patO, partial [Lachnellula suecica]
MIFYRNIALVATTLQSLRYASAEQSESLSCKASLGSSNWPTLSQWTALNASISGRLLKPPPPAAVCHPEQPTYNITECAIAQQAWYTLPLHTENSISSAWNNWNNDSCLPTLPSHCSGEGYPIYVINATCKEDAKAGVDFARKHNIRLNVKSSGHDYLGRSTSPNSVSIWTHHLKGISISSSFRPRGCNISIDVPALTAGGGNQMGEANLAASNEGLYILSGGSVSVSFGGYITGGGHSALTSTYGMAADSVLELEIVSPTGDFLTLNECQNQDLFWAVRGVCTIQIFHPVLCERKRIEATNELVSKGGGSTFGVITSVTVRAWPEFKFLTTAVTFGTVVGNPNFYPALTYFFSQFPHLSSLGITSYNGVIINSSTAGNASNFPGLPSTNGTDYSSFQGIFMLPVLSAQNTTSSLSDALKPLLAKISSKYPEQFIVNISNVTTSPTFYDWWFKGSKPDYAGIDIITASRLIGADALRNTDALETTLRGVLSNPALVGFNFYLLGGRGLADAVPRGGSDAVNPAWRKAIVHAVTGVSWTPLDNADRDQKIAYLTNNSTQYLRDLDPDSGAYVNEANPYEPDWQHTFWGSNYERLLEIKRKVDPGDVFWCQPCVGSEGWEMRGNKVCKVEA